MEIALDGVTFSFPNQEIIDIIKQTFTKLLRDLEIF